MSDTPDAAAALDIEAIRAVTADLRLGHPLHYFPAIGSTNTYAAELARAGAAEGTLVTTDDQTAGRGRIGRAWKSLPGQQLAISLVLYPAFPSHFLVMASALAVAETIEAVTGIRPASARSPHHATLVVGIKWPNDVQISHRKVCGILIETSADYAILGIGLNVNGSLADDPELAARATTLAQTIGHPISREALAIELLRRLDAFYARLTDEGESARTALREAWRARLVTLGQRVTTHQGEQRVVGRAEDVDDDGMLLLRRDDGTLSTITWGDVEA